MTKEQFIYRVLVKLGGGHATADVKSKYRPAIIDSVIGDAFNDLIVKVWQNSTMPNKSDLDAYVKIYFNVAVQPNDHIYPKPYLLIPGSKLLQLPNNNAIRAIYTEESTPKKCIYRELYADNVYNNLEVNTYLTEPRYEVLGERIYLTNFPTVPPYATIHLIVRWDAFLSTEQIPAPLENDGTLLDIVVQRLLQMPVEDKIIDNNVTQLQ